MFFKKEKKIVLDCYTSNASAYNYFPIVETKKTFPRWLQKLQAPYFKSPEDHKENVKSCPAFVDYFRLGLVFPLWSDLWLEVGEIGSDLYRWQYSDFVSHMEFHPNKQYGLDKKEYQHFKLISPWVFSCSEDIKFFWSEPSWRFGDFPETVEILNGVMSFKTNAITNINMMVKRTKEPQKFLIKANTPLTHLIPLTDKKVELRVHLVNDEVLKSIDAVSTRVSFFSREKKKIQHSLKTKFKTLA